MNSSDDINTLWPLDRCRAVGRARGGCLLRHLPSVGLLTHVTAASPHVEVAHGRGGLVGGRGLLVGSLEGSELGSDRVLHDVGLHVG
jgi:hypothetical protein